MDTNTSVTQILDSLRVIVQALSTASRVSEREAGITGAQRFILQKLGDAGELTVNDLAAQTHTHQSTVSTVLTKLEKKGLITRTRSLSDGRVQLLKITAEGKTKLRRKQDTVQDRLIHSIEGLSSEERRQCAALLSKLLLGAGLESVPTSLFLERETTRRAKRTKEARA